MMHTRPTMTTLHTPHPHTCIHTVEHTLTHCFSLPLPIPLQRLLHGEAIEPMMPWYRGFRGGVQEVPSKTGGKSYNISGIVSQVGVP